MEHPFQRLSPAALRLHAWGWFAATVCVGTVMTLLDAPLHNSACPNGIISFELAFTDSTARAMVASWDATTRLIAALGLGFDYLFLACYSTAIGAVAVALSQGWPLGARIAGPIAWAAWCAALMDAIENAALIEIVLGDLGTHWAPMAGVFASVKFVLIVCALLFLLVALLQGRRGPPGAVQDLS